MEQKQTVFFQRFLKRLKSLIKFSGGSSVADALGFYHGILELESIKEPDINHYYNYPLTTKDDNANVILIDLASNPVFLKAYEENQKDTFHKHLFIGIPVIFQLQGRTRPLFSAVIEYEDLKGFDPQFQLLPYKISQMTFNSRFVEELELSVEKVDEIEAELPSVKSIDDLKILVKKYFGDDCEVKNELLLALTSKNIALSQILSEYRRLDAATASRNDILTFFLSNARFNNEIEKISTDEICPVTPMDDSQEKVVAHALGNRLTVVTGAPGTGKTQVILNLIANALLRNKSVLMASKNNKAVDNVKERFDLIDPNQYLIRYGKKENLKTQTIPSLKRLVSVLHGDQNRPAGTKAKEKSDNEAILNRYNSTISIIKENNKKLARIDELNRQISDTAKEKDKLILEKEEIPAKFQTEKEELRNRYSDVTFGEDITNIDSLISQIKIFRNTLEAKYSGFTKFWHNLFSKKADAANFLNIIEGYPFSLKTKILSLFTQKTVASYRNGQTILDNALMTLTFLERISEFQRKLKECDVQQQKALKNVEQCLTLLAQGKEKLQEELRALPTKEYLNEQLSTCKNILKEEGKKFLNAKIYSLLHQDEAIGAISRYTNLIEAGIPTTKDQTPRVTSMAREFLKVCKLSAVTSLSIKSSFPLSGEIFDLLIIDEASQCDVASAIPLILRAKQVVIIGDPMQLRHITSVKNEEETGIKDHLGITALSHLGYVEQSLWDYSFNILSSAKNSNSMLMLENHYRCHPDIIAYSNEQFYKKRLGQALVVKTDMSRMTMSRLGIVLNNVRGSQRDAQVNINEAEARRSIEIAKELCTLKSNISIGIVTPFRDQADYISHHLPDSLKKNVEVNTAHGFQGDEKDVIIYSLVVTDNSPESKLNWIDYRTPNLVNVAVTRARQTLFLVCNVDYILRNSSPSQPLGYLVKYALHKN